MGDLRDEPQTELSASPRRVLPLRVDSTDLADKLIERSRSRIAAARGVWLSEYRSLSLPFSMGERTLCPVAVEDREIVRSRSNPRAWTSMLGARV